MYVWYRSDNTLRPLLKEMQSCSPNTKTFKLMYTLIFSGRNLIGVCLNTQLLRKYVILTLILSIYTHLLIELK